MAAFISSENQLIDKDFFGRKIKYTLWEPHICDSDISDIHSISEKVDGRSFKFDLASGTSSMFGVLLGLLDVVLNDKALMLDEFDAVPIIDSSVSNINHLIRS